MYKYQAKREEKETKTDEEKSNKNEKVSNKLPFGLVP